MRFDSFLFCKFHYYYNFRAFFFFFGISLKMSFIKSSRYKAAFEANMFQKLEPLYIAGSIGKMFAKFHVTIIIIILSYIYHHHGLFKKKKKLSLLPVHFDRFDRCYLKNCQKIIRSSFLKMVYFTGYQNANKMAQVLYSIRNISS